MNDSTDLRANTAYRRAKILFRDGGSSSVVIEKAINFLMKAVALKNNVSSYYLLLGKLYRRALDISSALLSFRYALTLTPDDRAIQHEIVGIYLFLGKELFDGASLMKPSSFRKVLLNKAKNFFEEALHFAPTDFPTAWLMKSLCHIHLNEMEAALDTLERISIHSEMKAEMLILRGKLLWGLGFVEKGKRELVAAVQANPEHPEVKSFEARSIRKVDLLYRKSCKALSINKYKTASHYASQALLLAENDVKLHVLMSRVHRALGDFEEAFQAVQRAAIYYKKPLGNEQAVLPVFIVRETCNVCDDVSRQLISMGEYEKAIIFINKIIEDLTPLDKEPLDYRYYMNRGDCHRQLGRNAEALSDYTNAAVFGVSDPELRARVALSYYIAGTDEFNRSRYQDAGNNFEKCVEYCPHVVEYNLARARTRFWLSDFPRALDDFQAALALDPDNEEAQMWIRMSYSVMDSIMSKDEMASSSSPHKSREISATDKVKMLIQMSSSKGREELAKAAASMKTSDRRLKKLHHPSAREALHLVNAHMAACLSSRDNSLLHDKKVRRLLAASSTDGFDKKREGSLWSTMRLAENMAKATMTSSKKDLNTLAEVVAEESMVLSVAEMKRRSQARAGRPPADAVVVGLTCGRDFKPSGGKLIRVVSKEDIAFQSIKMRTKMLPPRKDLFSADGALEDKYDSEMLSLRPPRPRIRVLRNPGGADDIPFVEQSKLSGEMTAGSINRLGHTFSLSPEKFQFVSK